MTGKRTILVTAVLAILSVAGLIGMLVVEGAWDVSFFALAIMPLLVGFVSWWCRGLRSDIR